MYDEQIQTQLISPEPACNDRSRRLYGALTEIALRNENALYANTGGVSQGNRSQGWRPGYMNTATGEIELSRYSDGRPAPVHVFDGLPEAWVQRRDAAGHVVAVGAEIVSGFIRNGRFFSREQAARATAH